MNKLLTRNSAPAIDLPKKTFRQRVVTDFRKHWVVYAIALLCLSYYFVFRYAPMGGLAIAFKNYRPARGLWGSKWVGFKWFEQFFSSYYFPRLLRNTLTINLMSLLIGSTLPIFLALLLNEVRSSAYKRTVQTVTYMPHFVSLVVACGIVLDILSYDGLFNQILSLFGVQPILFSNVPEYFPWIYVFSDVWQNLGYNSIVYLAALSSINVELFDAAAIDGCNRFQRVWHVTIPGILPTIILLLLMKVGSMMSVGYEKIILLYNDAVLERADVFSSFVYRYGMLGGNYSYSAAVDLFNNVVNILLLVIFNGVSRKISDISLW
ncbi:MAG: sugar ABC transporter permease [Clostridia bacterium]|nr:sugar ABC transporter permease [Clostridia bacterium]